MLFNPLCIHIMKYFIIRKLIIKVKEEEQLAAAPLEVGCSGKTTCSRGKTNGCRGGKIIGCCDVGR